MIQRHSRGCRGLRPARTLPLWLASALVAAALVRGAPAADTTAVAPTDTAITPAVAMPSPGQTELVPAVEQPFRPGESLKFAVQYGIVRAGTAYLEIPQVRDWKGHEVYAFTARAESNAFFSRFYKVRNKIESYWDPRAQYTWRYSEDRREGSHKFRSEIEFDHDRNEAIYPDGQAYPIPPQVQDALSAFYYTRTQALPLGGSIVFDYHASKKSQPLQVRVIGRERVNTPAGTFDCVAIEPIMRAGGIFKNNGRLVIWLTEDARRMPVLMRSRVAIGSISVVLLEARPGA